MEEGDTPSPPLGRRYSGYFQSVRSMQKVGTQYEKSIMFYCTQTWSFTFKRCNVYQKNTTIRTLSNNAKLFSRGRFACTNLLRVIILNTIQELYGSKTEQLSRKHHKTDVSNNESACPFKLNLLSAFVLLFNSTQYGRPTYGCIQYEAWK